MKNLYANIIAVIAITLTMISCKDNNGELDRIAPPRASAFQNLRAEALNDLAITRTFKAEDGLSFTTSKGTEIIINGSCLETQGGDDVAGDVTLTFIETYDIGNMVVTNKPLMGINGSGELHPLITGGQFFLEVKQGNEVLKPGCSYQVKVKAENTGALDNQMLLWEGEIDDDGNLTWRGIGREQVAILYPNAETATYDINLIEFGWTNVDKFWNRENLTPLNIIVPNGYNGTNAAVYLAYEGEPNVLAHLDRFVSDGNFFTEHSPFVPVGLNMHVIFTSESNGSLVYAIKSVTVVADMAITISESELNTTTKANLVNMINALHD